MRSPRVLTARAGVTLVEVMVALVLVAVGLLGIAGSAALLTRRAADAEAGRRGTRLAVHRMAALAAGGCAAAADGSSGGAASSHRERWTVSPPGGAARLVTVRVEWPRREGAGRFELLSALLC